MKTQIDLSTLVSDLVVEHDILSEWRPAVLEQVEEALAYLHDESPSDHIDRTHGSIRHDLIGIGSASMICALLITGWPVRRRGRYLIVTG